MKLSARPSLRTRIDCRRCGSSQLEAVMRFVPTPPANAFVTETEKGKAQECFPLVVHLCRSCAHVQLLDIVDPEILFRDYVYVSATSPVFVEHFRRYSQSLLELTGARPGARVLEIGSNDGTLLQFFKQAQLEVLGVDPARAIAQEATARGIPTRAEFFTSSLARQLAKEGWCDLTLIVANNVFAHADDLQDITAGVASLLSPEGIFVFEVSYLLDVFQKTLFDTIYHEHLSYHSVKPLVAFFRRHNLELFDAVRIDPHGGSLRVFVKRASGPWPVHPRVTALIAEEERAGLHAPDAFRSLFARIEERKQQLTELLAGLKKAGKRLAGFGAPAKATTLMFHFGIGPETIDYLVDESPLKQGRYSPGFHIPVVPSSWLYEPERRPDAVVILAWNFAESIMAKHQRFREAGGRFIIPLPYVETR
jgi:SAM-dependent methyltransferase